MKSYILIFKNGHFYNKEDGSRVELQDGGEFMVGSSEKFFLGTKVPGNDVRESWKHKEKRQAILQEIKEGNPRDLRRVFAEGRLLYFEISCFSIDAPLRGNFVFEAQLLEDLYVYKKNGKIRLEVCACKVVREVDGQIDFFEEVFGSSPNDLYKCTFVHYFRNIGHATANAFDRFSLDAYGYGRNANLLRDQCEAVYNRPLEV